LINDRGATIPYQIAKFGDIPYGKKIIAPLVAANPFNACTELKAIR